MNNEEKLKAAAAHILNTCENDVYVAEEFGVSSEELLEYLSEEGIERCDVCEWWCDDFADNPNFDFICNDCNNA